MSLFNPTQEIILRILILEIYIATTHTACHEHSVCVLDEVEEFVLRSFDDRIIRVFGMPFPATAAQIIDQVFAEDDTYIIEFEALGRIYAAYLLEAVRIMSPETGLRDIGGKDVP